MNRPRDNYRPGNQEQGRRRDNRYYHDHDRQHGHRQSSRSPSRYDDYWQPPLPPGPPPPGPPPHMTRNSDRPPPHSRDEDHYYRPYQDSRPRHQSYAPLPPRNDDMFRFQGAQASTSALNYDSSPRHSDDQYYKPDSRKDRPSRSPAPLQRDTRERFDFRPVNGAPEAPSFPPESHYRSNRSDGPPRGPRDRTRGGFQRGQPSRGPRGPVHASERALLRANRERTPERLAGMDHGPARFKAGANSSASEDEDVSREKVATPDSASQVEPQAKRVKVAPSVPAEQAEPKWSNVDAYGLVVPADSQVHKPKNLVGMIRKEKIDAQKPTTSAPKADDFISLQPEDTSPALKQTLQVDTSLPPKPTFSHLDNLHPNRTTPVTAPAVQAPAQPTGQQPKMNRRASDVISISSGASETSEISVYLDSQKDRKREQARNDVGPLSHKRKRQRLEDLDYLHDIAEVYQPDNRCNPIPWIGDPPDVQGDAELWLHQEIKLWYSFVRPQDFEERVRLDLINRIQSAARDAFPGVRIDSFGSFASKLYLPNADMDLVARSSSYVRSGTPSIGQNRRQMQRFAGVLQTARIVATGTLVIIAGARVPIIKFKDRVTGIRVDISFENDSGLMANETLIQWKERFPAMPWIVSLLKQFLAMRDLHEVHTGGLGGFSIICLVCCTLAKLEREHGQDWDPLGHLDDVLLHVLGWFGHDFDVTKHALDMRTFKVVPRSAFIGPQRQNMRLLIIDPNNPSNDVSGGTSRFYDIFKLFRLAHKALVESMDDFEDEWKASSGPIMSIKSILGCAWAANYNMYQEQRDRLRNIDQGKSGNSSNQPPKSQVNPPTSASRSTERTSGPSNHNTSAPKPSAPTKRKAPPEGPPTKKNKPNGGQQPQDGTQTTKKNKPNGGQQPQDATQTTKKSKPNGQQPQDVTQTTKKSQPNGGQQPQGTTQTTKKKKGNGGQQPQDATQTSNPGQSNSNGHSLRSGKLVPVLPASTMKDPEWEGQSDDQSDGEVPVRTIASGGITRQSTRAAKTQANDDKAALKSAKKGEKSTKNKRKIKKKRKKEKEAAKRQQAQESAAAAQEGQQSATAFNLELEARCPSELKGMARGEWVAARWAESEYANVPRPEFDKSQRNTMNLLAEFPSLKGEVNGRMKNKRYRELRQSALDRGLESQTAN